MVSNGRPVRSDGVQLVGVSLCEYVKYRHGLTPIPPRTTPEAILEIWKEHGHCCNVDIAESPG